MGIVKYQPDKENVNLNTPETIKEQPESLFTALVPPSRVKELIKHVSGHPWTVNYYGVLRHNGNTLESFDPLSYDHQQPHYKINGLILQVDSPLSSSYDDEEGITSVQGSAIVPLGIRPNMGDLFLANVDSGEDAWLIVTAVERKAFTKETLYQISYKVHKYASEDASFGETLERRINTEYYFNKDTNYFNRDLLISTSEHNAKEHLKSFMEESMEYYMRTFSSRVSGTVLLPGISTSCYDPYIMRFLRKVVPSRVLLDGKFYIYEQLDDVLSDPTVLDLIGQRSALHVGSINKLQHLVNVTYTRAKARLGTIGFSSVDYTMYPLNPNTDRYVGHHREDAINAITENPKTDKNYFIDNELVEEGVNNDGVFTVPLLPELFKDNYYIVTEQFYDYLEDRSSIQDLSYVEIILARFLLREAIDKEDLYKIIKNYPRWSLLHQFYYLPVMWLVIQSLM